LLAVVVAANVAAAYVLASASALSSTDFRILLEQWAELFPMALGAVFVGILNAQVSSLNKARIVFGRWHHPLPGAEAFSRHLDTDPRIDKQQLFTAFGPFPSTPSEQNSLWYRMFKTVEEDPSVQHVHREFLFARDYTAFALCFVPVLGGIAMAYFDSRLVMLIYLAVLVLQFVLVRNAARNHAVRLVTTVLALKSAGK
jgi:hypothetical protein